MVKKIALLALAASLFLSSAALAAGEGNGTIEGQITNGTENGSSVADQEITLQAYMNDNEAESFTTQTDPEGNFTFEGLDTSPEYTYQASLEYQGAQYSSDTIGFSENETSKTLDFNVYDPTDDDSNIVIATAHSIIFSSEDYLVVQEYLLFANNGDRTYVGSDVVNEQGQKQTLRFLLPKGATQITPVMGLEECCVVPTADGFVDTLAIQPGMQEISYSYTIDNGGGDYSLPIKTAYPVYNYDILAESNGITLSADLLTTEEPLDMDGRQFQHLSGSNIPAGATLTVKITGSSGDSNTLLWVMLAVLIVALVSAGSYYLTKKKPQAEAVESSMPDDRDVLLAEMARLDDEFESNNIPENEYRQQRSTLKSRLINLMQEESKEKDGS